MASRVHCHFNVAPRYTPGSPAMVDERTALRVVQEERDAHLADLAGYGGEEAKRKAEQLRLDGVVEHRVERQGYWVVTDLITGRVYKRPMISGVETCKHCGIGRPVIRAGLRPGRGGRMMHTHERQSPLDGSMERCPGSQVERQQVITAESPDWKYRYQL